jgi:Domain of unknown function (DUF4157)
MSPQLQSLNRSHTNLASNFVLQRKCSCGKHTASGGQCAECSKKKTLQKKLRIGAVNDPLEHEADRVADQVMRMPLRADVGATPPKLQRLSHAGTSHEGEVPESVARTLSGSGHALDHSLREDMGSRFGYDFSNVRIHQGGQAEQSARDVNAKAYTVGNNIVFGAGEYAPSTESGRRLVAHELAHVVQQGESHLSRQAQSQSEINSGQRHLLGSSSDSTDQLRRQTEDGPDGRPEQIECVKRLGGCPNSRPGGLPEPHEIHRYNEQCRTETEYDGQDVTPSGSECTTTQVETRPPLAQVCARPLRYPVIGLVANHAYVVSGGNNYAIIAPMCTPTDGGSDNMATGTAARTFNNSPDPCDATPQCVTCRPKRGVGDVRACLASAFASYNSPAMHRATGPNSNTFAGTLARACCARISTSPFTGFTPGWDDPAAPSRSADCPSSTPVCT